ncbi:MAG: metal ABC transporter substrate-binding protein [Eubacterium sp.]
MSKLKKVLSIVLCLLMLLAFGACSKNSDAENENNPKISIICTIFPEYDWVKNILGSKADNVELTLLLDNGVDLHNYQPTVEDLVKISSCDMFVHVGGESDSWVDDALANATNENMVVINLLDILGDTVKEEEVKEGMETEEEESNELEYDEHVWLSLKNAMVICNELSERIQQLDSANAQAYKENTENYVSLLTDLDNQYRDVCINAKTKTLLFGDRFPFRYLVEDYGLDYYAAFAGCSAETEASFETISFLAQKVDELGLTTVLTIEGTDHKIAETIIKNTSSKDQSIGVLNSMQGTTLEDSLSGTDYLSIMTDNLSVLERALA